MTNSMYELTTSMQAVQALAEQGEDVTDTLLSLEGDIEVKAENTNHIIKMKAYDNTAIDAEIDRLTKIKKANENAIERLKLGIENMMIALNRKEIKTPLFSAKFVKNPPAVVIDDEEKVDARFLTVIPQTYKIDKNAIKDAIKAGANLTHAHLTQSERLQLK